MEIKMLICAILVSLSFHHLSAQNIKIEHEKRIKKIDFPEPILEQLEPILKNSTANKFYLEFDGENYFYELKTKHKGEKLSIKFTDKGQLIDVERLFELRKIEPNSAKKIKEYLDQNFKKYKIKRFQIQYSTKDEEVSEDFIEDFLEKDTEDMIINYEMEAEVLHEDGQSTLEEFLFDANGNLIQQRKVKRRDEDFILY